MNVEDRARSAGVAVRRAAQQDLDARAMFGRLEQDHRRKRRTEVAAVMVLALVLVLGAAAGLARMTSDSTSAPPAHRDQAVRVSFPHCASVPADCEDLAAGTYRFPLSTPFTAEVPEGWLVRGVIGLDADLVSDRGAGLSVVMDPQGSLPVAGRKPDPAAGQSAAALAGWLASRPYLRPTSVVRTRVSGFPAYAVDVALRPGVTGTVVCQPSIFDCVPMVLLPFGNNATGISQGQVGRMVFVDLPHASTALVYLWDGGETEHDLAAVVAELQPVVSSIRFEPRG